VWLTPYLRDPQPEGERDSIAQSRKPPIRLKHLRDISYTSRVIADFVLNFVAIATVVGRARICLTLFNSPAVDTP